MVKNKILEFEFELKTKTKFGVNEALNIGRYLKELSFKKIGIIVDSVIFNLDYTKKILENIGKEKFNFIKIWKYNLGGEPDYDSLDKIKLLFLNKKGKSEVDCFVGIGGGSVIDFAKGLATLAVNPGKAIKYRGFPADLNPSLPTIALPTTAGTGSEVTYNAVFIDRKEKKKLGINTIYNFPVLAILDPILTLSCSKTVTVSSGIDALVHVLEGYVSRGSNYFARIFAKDGFRLIFNNLSKVLDRPKDIEIRANLQLGAYFGGLTLLGSGGGPTGALSYLLGVHFKVPHGIAGGVFLPYIVEFNVKKGFDYSELYESIEGKREVASKKLKNQLFAKEIFKLCQKIGVPSNIKVFGVDKENIKVLLDEAVNFEKAFLQNPVPFAVEEGKKLLTNLINK
jgi:alcohol dehydrogenase